MNENPPLTAATVATFADAVRAGQSLRELAEAAGVTAERLEEFARTMQHLEEGRLDRSDPIIYTNRAARRARARAERKN